MFGVERKKPQPLDSFEMRPRSRQPFNSERLECLIDPRTDFKRIYRGEKITDEAIDVCQHLRINPSDLLQRKLSYFEERARGEKIALLHFQHYEERRIHKINQIVDCMRNPTRYGYIQTNRHSPPLRGNTLRTLSQTRPHTACNIITHLPKTGTPNLQEKKKRWEEVALRKKKLQQEEDFRLLQMDATLYGRQIKTETMRAQQNNLKDLRRKERAVKRNQRTELQRARRLKEEQTLFKKGQQISREYSSFFVERTRPKSSLMGRSLSALGSERMSSSQHHHSPPSFSTSVKY